MVDGAYFKRTSSEVVFDGSHLQVSRQQFLYEDGSESTREVVDLGEVVVIAAVDEGGLYLISQPREAVDEPHLWELPAGGVDDRDAGDLEAAARRELSEETGKGARELRLLRSFYSTPGAIRERMHLFLATDLHDDTSGVPDEDERLNVGQMPLAELDAFRDGDCRDGKTLIGVAEVLRLGSRLRVRPPTDLSTAAGDELRKTVSDLLERNVYAAGPLTRLAQLDALQTLRGRTDEDGVAAYQQLAEGLAADAVSERWWQQGRHLALTFERAFELAPLDSADICAHASRDTTAALLADDGPTLSYSAGRAVDQALAAAAGGALEDRSPAVLAQLRGLRSTDVAPLDTALRARGWEDVEELALAMDVHHWTLTCEDLLDQADPNLDVETLQMQMAAFIADFALHSEPGPGQRGS